MITEPFRTLVGQAITATGAYDREADGGQHESQTHLRKP